MMKCSFQKSDLLNGINIVTKAVPTRTTMTILECILIDATLGEVHLMANDMELGIDTVVSGTIFEEGKIAVEAKIFSEMIRKLPDSEVTIYVDENDRIEISCEKAVFHIPGRNGEEFPYLPEIAKDHYVVMSQFTLREMIQQTIFSISASDTNKIMNGELLEVDGNSFTMTSLDGHRISLRKSFMEDEFEHSKVIVPGKTLSEVSKILTGEKESEVILYFSENHVLFSFDRTIVVSRLIEGEYFRISQMMTTDYETKIVVNRKKLQECIDRSLLFVRESDKKPLIFDIRNDNLELSMNSQIGSMVENLDIDKIGNDLMIGFNPKFLMDALRVIDDENINIYMINSKSPCFIRNDDSTYVYLILPVNFISSRG